MMVAFEAFILGVFGFLKPRTDGMRRKEKKRRKEGGGGKEKEKGEKLD